MYQQLGISERVELLAKKAENELKDEFNKVDRVCEINSIKVLKAFQDNNLSEIHFGTTTGYGYSDIGRDTIEKIYSKIFKAEDSLVRNQFISGTHALTVTLFGLLRPNDTLLSITGTPYDTLHEVIGIKENESSLKAFGINYEEIDLIDNDFNYKKIQEYVPGKKNPFATTAQETTGQNPSSENTNGNINSTTNTGNSSSNTNTTNNTNKGYLPDKGTK